MQSHLGHRTVLAFDDEGHGPPVLMVHGLLSDARIWGPVAEALSTNFRVIRCDLRGHGRSPRPVPQGQRSPVGDLIDLLDSLGLAKVHLVGHGAGANPAAGLAVQAPERALSLTAVEPVIRRSPISPAVQDAWHLETMLRWLETGHGAVVRRPEHVAEIKEVIAQQTLARCASPVDLAAPVTAGRPEGDPGRLRNLACPVLVMVGAGESRENLSMVEAIFGSAPSWRLERVDCPSRHLPLLAPGRVAALLAEFLRAIPVRP